MGFLDLFRAKWKHSNVEIRSDAVRELDKNDVEILLQVARRDVDARVRRIAVKKLEDPWILTELAEAEPDEALKAVTRQRAEELLRGVALSAESEEAALKALGQLGEARDLVAIVVGAPSSKVRTAALGRLGDGRALLDLVRKPQAELSLRLAALARINDPAMLAELAREETTKQVAVEAAGRLSDVQALKSVAARARCKAARKVAADRLPSEPGAAPKPASATVPSGPNPLEIKARRARLAQMCLEAETWAKHADLQMAHEEVLDLDKAWAGVGQVPRGDVLRRRFEQAQSEVRSRRDAAAKEQVRAALLESRAQTEAEAKQKRDQQEAEVQARRAVVDEETLKRRAVEEAANAEQRKLRDEERRLQDEEKARRAEERRRKDDERKEGERLRREEDAQRQAAEQAQLRGRAEPLCARLEAAIEGADMKAADSALKSATALLRTWRATGGEEATTALRERLSRLTDAVRTRITELRENEHWKRWAALPPLDQIVKEVEALAEVLGTVEDRRRAPAVLGELRQSWKAHNASPTGKNQELFERFEKAVAQVQVHIAEDEAKGAVERGENLKLKEALCVEVEALVSSSEWKETSDKIKELQAQWKKTGPVPQEQSDAIWRRFRGACDAFFARRAENDKSRDEDRAQNLVLKEAFCVRAEALAAAVEGKKGVDWRKLSEEMKGLQKEWQEVGPVPRDQADAVWKRVRAAADRFFEARKEGQKELDAERSKNLEKKVKLCLQVEALAELEDVDDAMRQVKLHQAEWKKIGPVAKADSDALWRRFRAACDRVFKGPELLAEEAAAMGGTGVSGFTNRLPLGNLVPQISEPAAPMVMPLAAAGAAEGDGAGEPSAEEEWATPVATASHTIDPALEEGWDLDGEEHK